MSGFARAAAKLANGQHRIPQGLLAIRAFCRRVPWRNALLSLGLVVQAGLLWLLWELVDLVIRLFEVWVLLARHSLGE